MLKGIDMIKAGEPWMIIGDFNCTLSNGERSTIEGVSVSFLRWNHERDLIDHGFVGTRFTWNHGKCRNKEIG